MADIVGYCYATHSPDPTPLIQAGADPVYLDQGSQTGWTALTHHPRPIQAVVLNRWADLGPKRRTRRQWLQSQGIPILVLHPGSPKGPVPFGYRRAARGYELDPVNAPIIRAFFKDFLLYGSLRQSVRLLHQTYHKPISVATGQRWLRHPVYRGHWVTADGTLIPNTHPALLTPQEAAQIDRWLRRHASLPRRAASSPRSLSGLVICQHCQHTLTVLTAGAYTYLRCPTCRYNLPYPQILEQVITRLTQALAHKRQTWDPETPPISETQRHLWQQKIAENVTILERLPQSLDQGILDPTLYALRERQLRQEIAQLQAQLQQLPPPQFTEVLQNLSIPAFWQDLSETERRSYLREVLRRITLSPNGDLQLEFCFDP